ncbi:RnfABCDGE type electron transport complex subunit B [Panacagrimonas sp.]|uniref:RnfABCDGE type electron transport complex subunit B n=1 Tax=Panacagrimonas sp. TaxID=2480088 RepID=UPI003B52B157
MARAAAPPHDSPGDATLADRLDALLPQTQCTRCGYPACRPYAEALASGRAEINRCPPGGDAGVARLAELLHRPKLPLDPSRGVEKSVETVARVVEADCIGCTKCIQACPVDAIVGAMNLMHTVMAAECNGCELCLPVCPVDCIEMIDIPTAPAAYQRAAHYRQRYNARNSRLARRAQQAGVERHRRKEAKAAYDPVAAALARARDQPRRQP